MQTMTETTDNFIPYLRFVIYTVDSRYLEMEGTIINTSRYPFFDISDL